MAEIPAGSLDVSETQIESLQTDMRRKGKKHSPPNRLSESLLRLSVNEKANRKEEMRKFLALPIVEKTAHTASAKAVRRKELSKQLEEEEQDEEERDKERPRNQNKRQTAALAQQIASRHELKMAMLKREHVMKDSKHVLKSMERQRAVLELSVITKKSEILRMDKATAKEERQLKQLERMIEKDNLSFEEFLRENEKKSVEARAYFEQQAKSKQEKAAEIKKLSFEMGTLKSDIEKLEEILQDYKRYQELLFKLSPPEWQEAQRAKSKCKDPSDGDPQGERNTEPKGSVEEQGGKPPAVKAAVETYTESTKVANSELESCCSEFEDEPELYFSDPQQLLDLVTELTEQNLSLIQNTARVEDTLEDLRLCTETTRGKIEKDDKQLTQQINDITLQINKERARAAKLKQKVQLHVSLNTEDQDDMLESLGVKVSEVHRCCVDDRAGSLSTLEKLTRIENHMSVLLQSLESIPEDCLDRMKKIKDSEKRSRQREEKLREQKEKQQERMRKYLERSLADSKKLSGKKLMPRCLPVSQKMKVKKVDNTPAEDELHAYLFTSDEMD